MLSSQSTTRRDGRAVSGHRFAQGREERVLAESCEEPEPLQLVLRPGPSSRRSTARCRRRGIQGPVVELRAPAIPEELDHRNHDRESNARNRAKHAATPAKQTIDSPELPPLHPIPPIAESRARSGPRTGRAWYARKYARHRPPEAIITHQRPITQRKTPRQVGDLPRGFDLPACLTGQCGNQAPPRPRRVKH